MKILITGAVKAGKSTVAKNMAGHYIVPLALRKNQKVGEMPTVNVNHVDKSSDLPILSTDALIGTMDWSAESEEVAKWFDRPDSFIIEGATVVRALRKWMASHPEGKPCDEVYYLLNPMEELSKGQVSSCKAQMTMWKQIEAELTARGVSVQVIDNKFKAKE